MITASRTHSFDAGHRVVRQGGKCEHFHGHTYEVHFTCQALELNEIGMVLDFGVMKTLLCTWLDNNYDHRFLLWDEDPWLVPMQTIDPTVVAVPYNPTAELMANFLLYNFDNVLPKGLTLKSVIVEETRKCRAEARR